MKLKRYLLLIGFIMAMFVTACNESAENEQSTDEKTMTEMEKKVNEFASFKLTTDLTQLTEKEKQMLPVLFEAASIMNDIFWVQAFGDKQVVMDSAKDEATKRFVKINYGPWERLNDNKPFIPSFGEKPKGANFYPVDMDTAEFSAFDAADKTSLYTMIRRDESGKLVSIPYAEFFKQQYTKVAELLKKASELAEDDGLKNYLALRADDFLKNDFYASDIAWMDMKTNGIDLVIGPIENYEDALYGYKAAHEAYILIKDKEWSQKLEKYAALLPVLQTGLPVEAKYKAEKPGSDSQLNAYDVVFYAGDCNAGSKTIAINLPNDEKVQAAKGSRRLQLKNAMQAKFDKILQPISDVIITPEQRKHVKFNSFFENTMFHEVAHGLGIKNTLDGKGTVRDALKETYSALEEGKADILGLYMVTKLQEMGELDVDLMDNYVTFMAGIFRSVRFGGASAHGKANLIRYNYFKEKEAFVKNSDGTYTVNFEKMKAAMDLMSEMILKLQGDGDYAGVAKLVTEKAVIDDVLQADLDKISAAGIPVDIVFEQGSEVLGL
ncbi:MAG: Zn-dependent hydrolase [Bacteroidales bacterium]|nr:Zn-dependent hydrolase [Bacteroidales bacterium]